MTGDIAIAHKDYDVRGGGEVLAEELARTFDCPLVVGRKDEAKVSDEFDKPLHELDLTRWQRWAIKRGGLSRSVAYMLAWQQDSSILTDYETVITSGNEPLWYVPGDHQTVIAYTHATPRFQTDLWHSRDMSGAIGRFGATVGMVQRVLYNHNTRRPDRWVANSDLVARRMELYWDVPRHAIDVVYPPVDTETYSQEYAPTEDVYLYLGRLAGHKRAGLAVQAFNRIDDGEARLAVAGRGPEFDRLTRLAGPNVNMLGYVGESEKRELYSRAKALIYPCENEDFGMVPIEAMASGTPVVGVNEGFTQFQIQDGKNGVLFDRGVSNLVEAIQFFERYGSAWSADEIERFASQFGVDRFRREMEAVVETARRDAAIETDLELPEPEETDTQIESHA